MAKRRGQKGEGREGCGTSPIQHEIDNLFQLPVGEFTHARNALAARRRVGEGRAGARPHEAAISAWIANQLYWRDRKAFDRLLAAGEQFRTAQAAQLAGNSVDMRAPLAARRVAVMELAEH